MKHRKWLGLTFAALLPTLIACGDDGNGSAPDAEPLGSKVVKNRPFQLIAAPYTEIAETAVSLTRDPDTNSIYIDSFYGGAFPEGEVVTVWWAVFNKVSECTSPNAEIGALCGVPDMTANPAVEGALLYAGPHPIGSITVPSGGVDCPPHQICDPTFSERMTLNVIASDAEDDPFKNAGPGNGLNDALNSEIHIILQKHGAALTGDELLSQETEFNGGCKPGQTYEGVDGACALFQVAAFQPAE